MPVICAACQTENREHAMFCRGCAGKLPAFAATGPSVLEVMKSQREAESSAAAGRPSARRSAATATGLLSAEMRTFWLRLGALMLAVMLAFVAWSSYVTRRVPIRGGTAQDIAVPFDSAAAGVPPRSSVTTVVVVPPISPSATSTPSTLALPPLAAGGASDAGTTGPAIDTPLADAARPSAASANSQAIAAAVAAAAAPPVVMPPAPAAPAAPVALSASLSPGESALPSGRRLPAQRRELRSTPERLAAADPRRGCEGLNFIFAAHCEATHCDQAAFSANPRCDAVRAQRQRDLARRNLEF